MAKKFTADRAEFKPSVLMQLAGLSKGMDDLIDLSIGDPDFTTPEPILTAGYQDALKGYTHYSPAKGYPDTIQAVVDSYKRDLGIEIAPENVIICASGAYSMGSLFLTPIWSSMKKGIASSLISPITGSVVWKGKPIAAVGSAKGSF